MRRALLLLIPFVVVSGCAKTPTPGDRPSDRLLDNSVLQRIVDLQVNRDGPALVACLNDEDPQIRARAAFALGSVQYGDAVPALIDLLDDDDSRVRADAAFAIGQTADSLAAIPLLDLLRVENDVTAGRRCLEALGKTGGIISLRELLTVDYPTVLLPDLALAVGRYGIRRIHDPDAVRMLVGFLDSSSQTLRHNAAYYFGRINQTGPWSDSAAEIREILDSMSPDDPAAMYLLQGLARLDDEVDTGRFVDWLNNSPDWRIRTNAARTLGSRMGEANAMEALLARLDDRSGHVAVASAQALAGSEVVREADIERIRNWIAAHRDRWEVAGELLPLFAVRGEGNFLMSWIESQPSDRSAARSMGFAALGRLPGTEAFDVLADATQSDNTEIASSAVEALAGRWRSARRGSRLSRASARELDVTEYYELFADALQSGNPSASYAAVPVLADSLFRPLGSVDLMIDVYQWMQIPEDIEPMVEILRSLGRSGAAKAMPLLRKEAGSSNHVISRSAAGALGMMTGEEVEQREVQDHPEREIDWDYLSTLGSQPLLSLETEKGTIVVRLAPEEAPLTVQTITQFAAQGLYDGVPFHRVVPNFVIQGGDFDREDGFGGPGFAIRSEFTRIPYLTGVIGMASAGKDTEGSQYFITHSMQPHLDGGYTAFGYVIEGMEVVDRIYRSDRVVKAEIVHRP
jgi:peptidylprolyl isomerase